MLLENKAAFADFDKVYHRYNLDQQANQEIFNREGEKIQEIFKKYENQLCGHSEKGIYGKFSANLAEKFWVLIRKKYPKIDFIGVKLSQAPGRPAIFDIPKIKLN